MYFNCLSKCYTFKTLPQAFQYQIDVYHPFFPPTGTHHILFLEFALYSPYEVIPGMTKIGFEREESSGVKRFVGQKHIKHLSFSPAAFLAEVRADTFSSVYSASSYRHIQTLPCESVRNFLYDGLVAGMELFP